MLFAEEHFNGLPKPERYDKDFVGTAMEALSSHLIPFPYKVAKVLDPSSYRYRPKPRTRPFSHFPQI